MRIVHLSDIHLSKENIKDFEDLAMVALLDDLSKQNANKKIDLILITGDLIDKGGKSFGKIDDAFNIFKQSVIDPIKSKLNLSDNRFYFVPGNHDVFRDADTKVVEDGLRINLNSTESVNEFIDKNNVDNNYIEGIKRILPYKEFEKNFYHSDFNKKDVSNFQSSYVIEVDGKAVGINCLNTAWRCYDSMTDKDKIILGERQIIEGNKIINQCDIKIALMHHDIDWLKDFDRESIDSFIPKFYDILLCGHVHKGSTWSTTNNYGDIFISVAPSNWAGNVRSKDRLHSNGYSIIDYETDIGKIFVYHRRYLQKSIEYVTNTDLGRDGKDELDIRKKINIKKNFLNDTSNSAKPEMKVINYDRRDIIFLDKSSISDEYMVKKSEFTIGFMKHKYLIQESIKMISKYSAKYRDLLDDLELIIILIEKLIYSLDSHYNENEHIETLLNIDKYFIELSNKSEHKISILNKIYSSVCWFWDKVISDIIPDMFSGEITIPDLVDQIINSEGDNCIEDQYIKIFMEAKQICIALQCENHYEVEKHSAISLKCQIILSIILPIYFNKNTIIGWTSELQIDQFEDAEVENLLNNIRGEYLILKSNFVDRNISIDSIYKKVTNNKIIIIKGKSGSGKSSIIAKTIEELSCKKYSNNFSSAIIIYSFTHSINIYNLVKSIVMQCNSKLINKIDTRILREIEMEYSPWSNNQSKFNNIYDIYQKLIKEVVNNFIMEHGEIYIFIDSLELANIYENEIENLFVGLPFNSHIIICTGEKSEGINGLINNKSIEKEIIEIDHLNIDEISSILDLCYAEENNMQVIDEIYKKTEGNVKMIKDLLAKCNASNLDILSFLEKSTTQVDVENEMLFNEMANKWILFSTEILEEILLILSIFEYIDFISFDKLQSFLNYKGYEIRLPKIKKVLSKVNNQIVYTSNNKVKLSNKDFAEFVVDRFFSETDIKKFVTELFNWISKCIDKNYNFTVDFLKYLRKKNLVEELYFKENLKTFIEEKKKNGEGQYLFNIGFLMLSENKEMIEYSFEIIEAAVELNNSDAKGYLGTCLLEGSYLDQDVVRGELLLNEACELGNTMAKSILGQALIEGNRIARDSERGKKLLFEASNEGNVNAKLNIALRLITGSGVKANPVQGRELLYELIEDNNIRAMVLMARFLIDGVSIERNRDEGLRLIDQAINLGSMEAKLELAKRLINGNGIIANKTEGMNLLDEMANLGNVEAKRILAITYIASGDIKTGCQLFEELISKNDSNSMLAYSSLILDGKIPEKNKQIAVELLEKEIANKNIYAMREMGIILIEGNGVERNIEAGIRLLEDAISLSDKISMRELGYRYANGIDILQNKERGEALLLKSVEKGDINAKVLYGLTLIDNYKDQNSKIKGLELIEEAATFGNLYAKINLSNILFNGKITKKNTEKAIQLLEDCIISGDYQAARILGCRLLEGKDIPRDIHRAKELLAKAIENDEDIAKMILGEAIILREIEDLPVEYGINLLEEAARKELGAKRILGILLIKGLNITQDKVRGESLLRYAADNGDILAIKELYDMLLDGRYLEQNINEGEKYLMKAIAYNDDVARLDLADRLLDGDVLLKDKAKGQYIYEELVKKGNEEAMLEYGNRLITGNGVIADKRKGEELLRESMSLGNLNAKRELALSILDDKIETSSRDEALRLLEENILEFDLMTMLIYGERLIDGDKVEEDVSRGIKLLEECIKRSSYIGKYHLGKRLVEGINVDQQIQKGLSLLEDVSSRDDERTKIYLSLLYINGRYVPKDVNKGIESLNDLILNGSEEAKEVLAFMLVEGDGIKRDKDRGICLLNELVERENLNVLLCYGQMLLQGFYVDKDSKRGEELLNRATKKENYYASYVMGKRLLTGDGVRKHKSRGIKEFKKAGRHGIASAIFEYGVRLKYGIDIPKNEEEGDRKIKNALNNSDADKKYSFAVIAYKLKVFELATQLFYESYTKKVKAASVSLAYMLRRNEIVGEINLPDIHELLEKSLKDKDHNAYINLALYYIRENNKNQCWEKVDEVFANLDYCGGAAEWWYDTSKQGDLEGELVLGLMDRYGLIPGISDISFVERFEKINGNGWDIPDWMFEDRMIHEEVAAALHQ